MLHAILTAIGPDRPGLVDEVSQFIFQRGGNIEDSRMVNLRGQFAMMVLVAAQEPTLRRLRDELGQLAQTSGLTTDLRPASAAAAPAPADAMPYRLVATAMDQPGLVHRISHVLRELGINIESLETRLKPAPYTGAPMFEMELVLSVPRQSPLAQVRQRLAGLCDELNVDWQLGPLA
jgi:glycine cleavage system transcriptional repressor